ncbi:MAG: molybdenum cofactor biosynthesis protein MoaE [Pseudomonadota bacterium]
MRVTIVSQPIDVAALSRGLRNPACGAFASFEGWVRDHNEGRAVASLEYEVYRPIAIAEGERILLEACAQTGATAAALTHREGALALGDCAVWVGAVAPHRDEAFAACRLIIDEAKRRLPIWKREHYVEGDAAWVNCERCARLPSRAKVS